MSAVLTEMVDLITGALVGIGQGIGEGITSMVQSLFIVQGTGGAESLTTFGSLVLIFAGLSLAFGLVRWCLNFFTSLGARNR